MISLLNLSFEDLQKKIQSLGLPKFIATQLWEWIYQHHVTELQKMTNISQKNRDFLETQFKIPVWKKIETLESSSKLAKKYIIELEDGLKIESVLLTEKDYWTLCVSSQVGCPLKCKFCVTGQMGFKRNLTQGEILAQILIVLQDNPTISISHLVFMGMGEPLLNLESILPALQIISNEKGLNIGKRKITLSTSGILEGIEKLLKEEIVLNLALSVGNANPIKRKQLMPVETKNPILDVARKMHLYQKIHNRKLTLEYTTIYQKNDSDQEITELGNLAKYLNAKVNLINLNPHPCLDVKPVPTNTLLQIKEQLISQGVDVTIRYRKGEDINAACGQLGESLL